MKVTHKDLSELRIDLRDCEEFEYGDYVIIREKPQHPFFAIRRIDGTPLDKKLQGLWTTPQIALEQIELVKTKRKEAR